MNSYSTSLLRIVSETIIKGVVKREEAGQKEPPVYHGPFPCFLQQVLNTYLGVRLVKRLPFLVVY